MQNTLKHRENHVFAEQNVTIKFKKVGSPIFNSFKTREKAEMLYHKRVWTNSSFKIESWEDLNELINRLKNLERERNHVLQEVFDICAEIENEAEELEKGLSILKEQMMEFEGIFTVLNKRKKEKDRQTSFFRRFTIF